MTDTSDLSDDTITAPRILNSRERKISKIEDKCHYFPKRLNEQLKLNYTESCFNIHCDDYHQSSHSG